MNSRNRTFTKKLRQLIATLIAGLFVFAGASLRASATVSIVDSLGAATTATKFSVFGSGGFAIIPNQFGGPGFTLTQPTTLTEIGGFINNCANESICSSAIPFTVQIRPAINGLPDPNTVLASFVLSNDNDTFLISYESVSISLPLQPGSYFALFAPQNDNLGFLLGTASIPFNYTAGVINIGSVDPLTGIPRLDQLPGAVRILGETNVVIDGCDSGVEDVVLPGGSTISELVEDCADGATTHGQFVSCIARLTNDLKKSGTITGTQKAALQTCAAQADIP